MLKNFASSILATISVIVIFFAAVSEAQSAVRFNPQTGYWEGNICVSSYAWAYVPFQPIGSLCLIGLADRRVVQGVIVNR